MSLASRLADLAAAIGGDIKALQAVTTNARGNTSRSTGSLAFNASEDSTLVLFPSLRLFKIGTSRAARIRIYATAAQRTDDAGRAIGVDPTGNHGLLFEHITTAEILIYALSPLVDLIADNAVSTYYMSVTNVSSTTGVVTVTFYYVRTE